MYLFKRNPDPRQKPPVGSRLNPDHPLSQGLVGCWLMNEGGGGKVYNLCGLNTGNLDGVIWKGGSLYNDGTSYQRVTVASSSLDLTKGSLSVVAFFLNTGSGNKDKLTFYSTSSGGDFLLFLRKDYDTIFQAEESIGYTSLDLYSTSQVNDGAAHMVVYCRQGWSSRKLFFDGKLEASDSTSLGPGSATPESATMCGDNSVASWIGYQYFQLEYHRSLTPAECEQLYEEPYGHILVPQYWYMVDFGAIAGTTITLIKMSQDWQGQDIKLNMNITTPAFGMSWTGKSAKANLAITLAKMTQSWVGKALYANKLITLAKTAITWTGKNILLEKIIHPAEMALSWVGKTITINGGALGRRFLGLYRRIIGDLIR